MRFELIATATFGVEAVVKREIQELGYRILSSENGKITFEGDERAVVRANLWLRTADRVLLKMAEFRALTFEELFQGTKKVDWASLIPEDGKFTVTCTTVKSKLHNEPACQSIVKKAIVEKMKETYHVDRFAETGAEYTVKITLLKDRVTLTVDTSGTGLHKRGYRKASVEAPIKETLAAALIRLSFWKPGRVLVDPCCGSGTIPIEAALIGRNIAPGIARKFAAQDWDIIPDEIWREEKKLAYEAIDYDTELEIYGFDIDTQAVNAAVTNAEEAGLAVAGGNSFREDFEKKCNSKSTEVAGRNSIKEDFDQSEDIHSRTPDIILESDDPECDRSEDIHSRTPDIILESDDIGYDRSEDILAQSYDIFFSRADVRNIEDLVRKLDKKRPDGSPDNGVIITNCPYAVRIGDEKIVRNIFRSLGGLLKTRPGWSLFAITPEWQIEKIIRKADRRRKLYNGNIETTYFQFHGKKPERSDK